ncbi:MAG: ATP-binding protein [Candidatus Woesearchaeota archaeon]
MALSIRSKLILLIMFLVVISMAFVGLYIGYNPLVDIDGNIIVLTPIYSSNYLSGLYTIGLITFIIILFVSIFIIHLLIRPLDNVIIGTQLVATGDLNQKIPKSSNDEFGRLVDSFNDMVNKLRYQMKCKQIVKNIAAKEKTKAELIIDAMGEGVIVTDKDHRILVFNEAASSIFNLDTKKCLGKHILNLKKYGIHNLYLNPDDIKGNKNKNQEFKIKHLDKDVNTIISPLFVNNNQFDGSVCIIRDVTTQTRADNMKKEFLSTVSHELRTPLTSIKGYASLIDMGRLGEINYRQSKAIKIINQESDRLMGLIESLLEVSRLESGNIYMDFKLISIEECFKDSLAQNLAKESGVRLRTDFQKNLPLINLDKRKIITIFNNLISNAVKFTKKGSIVQVMARKSRGNIVIRISDKGVGIKKADLDKIFNKFYQAEDPMTRSEGGFGLGLPIVKKIIDLHSGNLKINSDFGVGTEVIFSLPLHNIAKHNKE